MLKIARLSYLFLFLIPLNICGNELTFTENKGQIVDSEGNPSDYVLFILNTTEGDLYITRKGVSYVFTQMQKEEKENETGYGLYRHEKSIKYCRVDMQLKNAEIKKENIIKEDESACYSNYYLAHCPGGIINVHSYKKVTIKDIYPGIDWEWIADKEVKHQFIVHPGADASFIQWKYKWNKSATVSDDGILVVETPMGLIIEEAPYCYIRETGEQINSTYKLTGENSFCYSLKYDNKETLVIDPNLIWGTYYGGSNYEGFSGTITNPAGEVFVTGYVASSNFPVTNPGGGAYFQGSNAASNDIVILKFDNSGVRLWATYYGGTNGEEGNAMDIDGNGNIIITGGTSSTSTFPNLDPGNGAYFQTAGAGFTDAFILKFNGNGARLWATQFGGSGLDEGVSVAVDGNNQIVITGHTGSADFPVKNMIGAYNQAVIAGTMEAFILKFDNAGNHLWGTFYGGTGNDFSLSVTTDITNNIFITGQTNSSNIPIQNLAGAYNQPVPGGGTFESFILKFNPANAMVWATYYGGNQSDIGTGITTDNNGNIFVTGHTSSTNLPLQNPGGTGYFQGIFAGGFYDLYILKFNPACALTWGTYYGGTDNDIINPTGYERDKEIITDYLGNVYITAATHSSNIPLLNAGGYFQGALSGTRDVFLLQFNNSGTLLWATYSGSTGQDFGTALSVDSCACIFAVGEWIGPSSNGLLDPGGSSYYESNYKGSDESFIMKFCPVSPPLLTISGSPGITICKGDTTIITANGAVSYSWNPSAGLSSTTGINISAAPTITTTYTITGVSPCYVNDTVVTVTVIDPVVEAGPNDSICKGDTATLIASGAGSYLWNTGTTTAALNISPNTTTTYTVNNITGLCIATDSATVVVFDQSLVNAGNDTTIVSGTIVPLIALGGVSYSWQPVNGLSCVTCSSITASPTSTTTYYVYVTDSNGCTSIDSVIVYVKAACKEEDIFIPNAFSPNNDGENDVYFLKGFYSGNFTFYIYNRWGEMVFETTNISKGWDGKYKGREVNSGVFVYYLVATCPGSFNGHISKGNISLIR